MIDESDWIKNPRLRDIAFKQDRQLLHQQQVPFDIANGCGAPNFDCQGGSIKMRCTMDLPQGTSGERRPVEGGEQLFDGLTEFGFQLSDSLFRREWRDTFLQLL